MTSHLESAGICPQQRFKIAYFMAKPDGGCGVVPGGLTRGLSELGHQTYHFNPGDSYDYVFLFNVSAHIQYWDWIGLEQLNGYKFCFIDMAEYGWWTHYDYYKDKYYSAFAPLAIKAKHLNQVKLLEFLRGKSYPYFLREMYKGVEYHKNYHPIDYPLYFYSVSKKQPISFEEFKNRHWDIFVAWGHNHQTRVGISEKIRAIGGYKTHVLCNSDAKIPQFEYFSHLENAKLSISYDGYGSGSFRETEVLCRCVLFRNEQCVIRPYPLTDGVNFIEYKTDEILGDDKYPIYKNTNVDELMREGLKKPEELYQIYVNGYKHCMDYYTERAVANRILGILSKHDWGEVTID